MDFSCTRMSRRQILKRSVVAAAATLAPAVLNTGLAAADGVLGGRILSIPDLDSSRVQFDTVVGYRPIHEDGLQLWRDLKRSSQTGKTIFHNYGHGGGGITLSLGCARRIKEWIEQIIAAADHTQLPLKIAILGSGVAGLTVARELLSLRPNVALRVLTACSKVEETTSFIAGGQFVASLPIKTNSLDGCGVGGDDSAAYKQKIRNLVDASRAKIESFGSRTLAAYGIVPRKDFLRFAPTEYTGGVAAQGYLPFPSQTRITGYEFSTYLIEPPIFLKRLEAEIGGNIIQYGQPISNMNHLMTLPETIIINCTGVGSRFLFDDNKISGLEGRLTIIKNTNPAKFNYFVSGGCNRMHDGQNEHETSYMFCRSKDIVIGGTSSVCKAMPADFSSTVRRNDPRDRAAGKVLMDRMNRFVNGNPDSC